MTWNLAEKDSNNKIRFRFLQEGKDDLLPVNDRHGRQEMNSNVLVRQKDLCNREVGPIQRSQLPTRPMTT